MKLTGGSDWPSAWTHAIGREVARLRGDRRMTAQQLSDRCADLGVNVPRNSVSNLENGRRDAINLHEVVAVAAAMEVPPAELAFPPNAWIPYLPGERVTSYEAVEAFTGAETREATPGQLLDKLLPEEDVWALVNLVNRARDHG